MNLDLSLSGNYVMHDNTGRMQFFYASQSYGTLYAIYFKITLNGDYIDYIDFKLLNYKGIINLGFLSKDEDENQGINITKKEGNLVITFPVKAMTKEYNAEKIKPKEKINIKDFDTIFGERTLLKFCTHTLGNLQGNIIFDEEFYYRNGNDDFHELPRRLGQERGKNSSDKIITGNCVQTILKVIK